MKITDLDVSGFGVWNDLSLAKLSERMTVIYGANEAGKTTLMQFVRAMLYGLSSDRQQRYYPPVNGGQPGGTLQIDSHLGQLTVDRHWPPAEPGKELVARGQVTVRDDTGLDRSAAVLDSLLSGVDEPTYNNVFSVGLRELQELGTLDDTDAADLLYQLTTGLDRVSLVDVTRRLNQARDRLLAPIEASGEIVALAGELERLQRQTNQHAESGEKWCALQHQLAELDSRLHELTDTRSRLDDAVSLTDLALRIRPLWVKLRSLDTQLETLGPAPAVPDRSLDRLRALRGSIEQSRGEVEEIRIRRRAIRQEADSQRINRALWRDAARIEALAEYADWIASLQSETHQLRADIRVLETRLTDAPAPTSADMNDLPAADLPEVSAATLATLRGPARAVKEETARIKQVESELEQSQNQLDELAVKLETTLLDLGHEELPQAVDRSGELVNRLRRRLQVQQRLDEVLDHRKHLEEERLDLLDRQVLSPAALAWLGVPFVLGIALIGVGLVWHDAASLGWPVALLGLGAWGFGIVAKVMLERNARRELEDCESELARLTRQLEAAKEQRAELDRDLPRASGSLDVRLNEAERQLAQLEELLPYEATVQTLRQRIAAASRRREQFTESLRDARSGWHQALRRAGLPENLSASAVRQLAAGSRQITQSRRQLQSRRDELDARERELTALAIRIDEAAQHAKLPVGTDDPQVQLQQLVVALAEQKSLFQRRDELRHEDKELRRHGRELASRLRKLQHERRALIAQAGVLNEKQLQQLITRHLKRRQLRAERESIQEQWQVAIGDAFESAVVEQELEHHAADALQEQHKDLLEQRRQIETQQATVHQRRGQIVQEQKNLAADRQWASAQLQQSAVQQRLHSAVRQWAVLTITSRLLEAVRETYETHRQPETLREASCYFKELTDGQYVRIWTPLTEQALRVDAADGSSLSVDLLSSGTREAVFLSLRLALVADFARRGAQLPLVLDDVLVNFDMRRAHAAADVLCQFANAQRQVLLFTCHEHIVQLFESARAEVRQLPDRNGKIMPRPEPEPVKPVETVEPVVAAAPEPVDEPDAEPDDMPYKLAEPEPILAPAAALLPDPEPPIPMAQPVDIPEPPTQETFILSDLVEEPIEDEYPDSGELLLYDEEPEFRFEPELPEDEAPEDTEDVFAEFVFDEPVPLDVAIDEPDPEPNLMTGWLIDKVDIDRVPPRPEPAEVQSEFEKRFAWESPERYHRGGAAA